MRPVAWAIAALAFGATAVAQRHDPDDALARAIARAKRVFCATDEDVVPEEFTRLLRRAAERAPTPPPPVTSRHGIDATITVRTGSLVTVDDTTRFRIDDRLEIVRRRADGRLVGIGWLVVREAKRASAIGEIQWRFTPNPIAVGDGVRTPLVDPSGTPGLFLLGDFAAFAGRRAVADALLRRGARVFASPDEAVDLIVLGAVEPDAPRPLRERRAWHALRCVEAEPIDARSLAYCLRLRDRPAPITALDPLAEIDGRISARGFREGTASLAVAGSHRLRVGMRFAVYDADLDASPGRKGWIRVRKIGGDSFVADIVAESPTNPIGRDDWIASPFFDPDARPRFAVTAPADARDRIAARLRAAGGRVVDRIDERTDFVVVADGARPGLTREGVPRIPLRALDP